MTTNELDLEIPEEENTPVTGDADSSGTSGTSTTDPIIEELAALKETAARAQADYRNLLVRTERERGEMVTFMTEKIITKILPSLDSLERIVQFTPEAEKTGAVYQGVVQAASGLTKTLESMGVKSFSSLGEALDPALHEAIMQAAGEDGKIVTEIEKGYKLADKVIRHAKVVVGNGEKAAE